MNNRTKGLRTQWSVDYKKSIKFKSQLNNGLYERTKTNIEFYDYVESFKLSFPILGSDVS